MEGVSVPIFQTRKLRFGTFKGFAQVLTSLERQSWWLSPTVSVGVGFLTRPCHRKLGWALAQTHTPTTSPDTLYCLRCPLSYLQGLVGSSGLFWPRLLYTPPGLCGCSVTGRAGPRPPTPEGTATTRPRALPRQRARWAGRSLSPLSTCQGVVLPQAALPDPPGNTACLADAG